MGLGLGAASMAAADDGSATGTALERCLASADRTHELHAGEHRAALARKVQAVPVPPRVHRLLAQVRAHARLPKGMQVALVGTAGGRSASAFASGTIFLGSRLWQGDSALDDAQLAAVLAHELAHLEAGDVKHRLCEAVAHAGAEHVALADATQVVHRKIWSGRSDLAVQMMQRNHLRELRADRRGTELLARAGFPARAMADMLLKVSPHADDSGSHPGIEARLENLGVVVAEGPAVD